MIGLGGREVSGLSGLVSAFDAFFLDQFGVLHDGTKAYPGAVEALRRLRQAGAPIAIVSNSGRSARCNADRLAAMGFTEDLYDHCVTSGDVALHALKKGTLELSAGCTPRCLTISREGDRLLAETMGFPQTESGEDADLVVIAGSEADKVDMAAYRALLAPAARRGVPAICTNPDQIMLTAAGPRFGAGRIAEMYEGLGGRVVWVGKPYPAIYQRALELVGNPPAARVACIGDSIAHDVVGARGIGATSIFIRSGIHANVDDAALAEEARALGAAPDIVLPAFRW